MDFGDLFDAVMKRLIPLVILFLILIVSCSVGIGYYIGIKQNPPIKEKK